MNDRERAESKKAFEAWAAEQVHGACSAERMLDLLRWAFEAGEKHILGSHVARMDDALDHIIKVSSGASRTTKRYDWIIFRAEVARRNEDWNHRDMPEPRDNVKKMHKEWHDMREENTRLRGLLGTSC